MFTIIIFFCLLFAAPLFADNDRVRIHLKDGTVIEGELITFNDQTYRVKVGEEIKEIPWEQIDKIDILPQRKVPPAPQPITPTTPASPPPSYGYHLYVKRTDTWTKAWEYPDEGLMPSGQLSADYNEAGLANPADVPLQNGLWYEWEIGVVDDYGNTATRQVWYRYVP